MKPNFTCVSYLQLCKSRRKSCRFLSKGWWWELTFCKYKKYGVFREEREYITEEKERRRVIMLPIFMYGLITRDSFGYLILYNSTLSHSSYDYFLIFCTDREILYWILRSCFKLQDMLLLHYAYNALSTLSSQINCSSYLYFFHKTYLS